MQFLKRVFYTTVFGLIINTYLILVFALVFPFPWENIVSGVSILFLATLGLGVLEAVANEVGSGLAGTDEKTKKKFDTGSLRFLKSTIYWVSPMGIVHLILRKLKQIWNCIVH